jgi:hypothetical protein
MGPSTGPRLTPGRQRTANVRRVCRQPTLHPARAHAITGNRPTHKARLTDPTMSARTKPATFSTGGNE